MSRKHSGSRQFANVARSSTDVSGIHRLHASHRQGRSDQRRSAGKTRMANPIRSWSSARRDLEACLIARGGQAPVWWDFDPQPDATPNAFEFGHRVTVGVNAADGQIFGRFSLFSSIHFGMHFGTASSPTATKTVAIDIDPMAAHPPNDIKKTESTSALARVSRPGVPTAGLKTDISSKTQERVFSDLLLARRSSARLQSQPKRCMQNS